MWLHAGLRPLQRPLAWVCSSLSGSLHNTPPRQGRPTPKRSWARGAKHALPGREARWTSPCSAQWGAVGGARTASLSTHTPDSSHGSPHRPVPDSQSGKFPAGQGAARHAEFFPLGVSSSPRWPQGRWPAAAPAGPCAQSGPPPFAPAPGTEASGACLPPDWPHLHPFLFGPFPK